jgi:hypothetical protein
VKDHPLLTLIHDAHDASARRNNASKLAPYLFVEGRLRAWT